MPIHDWSKVDVSIFHNFHQSWSVALCEKLNSGLLPTGYFTLVEKRFRKSEGDVVALTMTDKAGWFERETDGGGIATATREPVARIVLFGESRRYADRANVLRIHRKKLGNVVGAIEIVSPGNKKGDKSFQRFKQKSIDYLLHGIQLSIIDLFMPTSRDPRGIHGAIWDEIGDEPYQQPEGKPLTVVSYEVGTAQKAYVEPVAVGDPLPSMPIFLRPGLYVEMPLEETYESTWNAMPAMMKDFVLNPDSTL